MTKTTRESPVRFIYKKDGESQLIIGNGPRVAIRKRSVICIIRHTASAHGLGGPSIMHYWATLRKAHIFSSKISRDDMYNSLDYTWCLDTESTSSVKAAKQLARDYAKKLGLRIGRFDERL